MLHPHQQSPGEAGEAADGSRWPKECKGISPPGARTFLGLAQFPGAPAAWALGASSWGLEGRGRQQRWDHAIIHQSLGGWFPGLEKHPALGSQELGKVCGVPGRWVKIQSHCSDQRGQGNHGSKVLVWAGPIYWAPGRKTAVCGTWVAGQVLGTPGSKLRTHSRTYPWMEVKSLIFGEEMTRAGTGLKVERGEIWLSCCATVLNAHRSSQN